MGWAMLVGLGLTGCPVGADLDTSYEKYAPLPSVTSTTGASGGCNNETVNEEALNYWCGTSTCHGTADSSEASAPLYLFSATRTTDLLDLPATVDGCTDELIVDTNAPEKSLIISSIKHTSPCGLEMPEGLDVEPEPMACIEEWVNGMIANAAAGVAQPGVGGTSAF